MSKRLYLVPCLWLASSLALAACGTGDEGGEAALVKEEIEKVAATHDPANCTRFQTQKFTEQAEQEGGPAALRSCEEDEEKEVSSAVSVAGVEVEGSTATAELEPDDGGLGGQMIEVELVKDGGRWKLNEIIRFTEFDRRKLIEGAEDEFAERNEMSRQLAACVIEAFEEASQAEIEEMLLSGSRRALREVVEDCYGV